MHIAKKISAALIFTIIASLFSYTFILEKGDGVKIGTAYDSIELYLNPELQASTTSAPAYQKDKVFISNEFQAEFPFNAVSIEWDESIPDATSIDLFIKFFEVDTGEWTDWIALDNEGGQDYEGYSILVNIDNKNYEDVFFIVDVISSEKVLDPLSIERVFGASPVTIYWNADQDLINLYAGQTQMLPAFFQAEYEQVNGPVTRLTSFTESLVNFLTYLALIPAIFYLLKVEFTQDYLEFKLIKNEWFLIIMVGYLYLILGNVLSMYASEFIGTLIGIVPSEAVNQMTIIRSLEGPGAIFMFLSAVIMGPIIEELIFRKSIFGLIKNNTLALIVSAVIFGSIHLIGEASILSALVNGISYYVMGFIFGYIYLKNNKNIMAPIAIHILSNLILKSSMF